MRRRNSLIALYASQYLIVGLFDNICLLGAVGGQGIDERDKYRTLRLWPDFNGILKTRFRVSILVWNVQKQRGENLNVFDLSRKSEVSVYEGEERSKRHANL